MNAADETRAAPPRRRSRWLGWSVCAGLILVALVLVCVVALMPTHEPSSPPPEILPVSVKTLRVQPLPELADTFDLTAVVEPECVVKVAAEVSGRIERSALRGQRVKWRGQVFSKESTLEEGQPISAGDPIAYLNKDLLQARFERSQRQFEYDEREYRRLLGLFERGTTSQTELDDAKTQRDISKALRDEAAHELERTTITAPISGILNRLSMEVGEYAVPGQQVAEIVDIERVKVVVDIPERDVYYLKVGQTAEIFVHAPEETELTGEITYMSELADSRARTTRLEITVDNHDYRLRSGQIVRVRLTRRVLTDVIMIPLGSVIPLEHGRVVYVVNEEDRAESRTVELGFIKGRSVRVLSGLEAGERLIVAGHRYVGPDQPVTIVAELNE
ncbi:MAG: efflux RND transporter periplasmic adaptor subunit [Phycisphaerae bacterium]|nr:efflux RND transporter periplasmic adaptor subunit [Phycisphaerae bacterium]